MLAKPAPPRWARTGWQATAARRTFGESRANDEKCRRVEEWACRGLMTGYADVAELADATDLGSVTLRGVEVQILSSAQEYGPVA